ncbi:Transducin/WD40 repeat-like superfamily protein [Euphorbia peplus]|nr:Transducin/WD40 repeat-like superfamily protein [Euphorbia peplus]
MKCRSVACIWSGAPPIHRVTATAVLNQPATLYTGGSDGSILWWNLSFSDSKSEIKPVAMLCGHAAPIADLAICSPVVVSGDDKERHNLSNASETSVSGTRGALISVCTDGVLCVWSRSSGHCRRRRKLPPWVGSPSIVCTMPTSSRYVCIGCCSSDATQLSSRRFVNSYEGDEVSADKEFDHIKPLKCAVVIVDTYSLTIVQTVFHGNSAIGPLKFMDVVLLGEDGENHSVFMADLYGRVQLVPILNDSNLDGEGASQLRENSQLQIWGSGMSGGQIVSIATSGNLIALVLKKSCIFRLLSSDSTIGEIPLLDNLLLNNDNSTQLSVIGAFFFGSGDAEKSQTSQEPYDCFEDNLVLWNTAGSAVVYSLSYLNDVFKCEALCQIPSASHPVDARQQVSFRHTRNKLLRIESVCFDIEEPLRWNTHVTLWSLCQKHENMDKLSQCQNLGHSDLLADWISNSSLSNQISDHGGRNMSKSRARNSFSRSDTKSIERAVDENYSSTHEGRIVTASMVISENLFLPYAIAYGFFNGDIKVVRFGTILGLDSHERSPRYDVNSHASGQYITGHTGAILCLAAHQMLGAPEGRNFKQVLVSGSMDSTIRIWDLDSCSLITVMHQHVAPVRQIIFPPSQTERPWSDCFLSVGEDLCVSLTSLETLRVERMFPAHPSYPEKVVWDGTRGYIACLCPSYSRTADIDALYIWDVKTGAQERVLCGTASHSMLDHFCKGISANSVSGAILNGNTSVSSLLLPIIEDGGSSQSRTNNLENRVGEADMLEPTTSKAPSSKGNSAATAPSFLQNSKNPIRCTCPFPGIATLTFDLASLMFSSQKHEPIANVTSKLENTNVNEQGSNTPSPLHVCVDDTSHKNGTSADTPDVDDWIRSLEKLLLRFSLSFLHFWNLENELDKVLMTDMELRKPENFILSSGLQGDKGSLTLIFPGLSSNLELWKSSSEFTAMRSLTMVSIAQRMISLSSSSSVASRDLAAFYTRNFAHQVPDVKPPLLQLLVSFWQDESEHVRMAARTLFHCSASRAIPSPLYCQRAIDHAKHLRSLSESEGDISKVGISANGLSSEVSPESQGTFQKESSDEPCEMQGINEAEESKILDWIESFDVPDWISCVGGTSQDAMTSHIIVAAALAIWYPSLVKPSLARLVVHPLIKLVMAMNGKYSSTAAELLAEGMEGTWKACISSEIPHLIADIFFQIECVSGSSATSSGQHPAVPSSIREILVDILLPSLAMADILGFLSVVESQIWSTASDSPVHVVSLTTVIRVIRGSPRYLVQYLDKVVNFVLHTLDPGNSVMRRTCRQSSMTTLKEVVRVFPMVALNDSSTRLAVGEAVGGFNNASISIYDMLSVTKMKVLDASGPPGLPALLSGAPESAVTTVISALSFSPDGEGLVAFSEHGLMIRWWSLESVWWEKLSRNLAPVPYTKMILVPPWEGFSPNSSRSSVMASIMDHDRPTDLQENARFSSCPDNLKMLLQNLDLSYRLEWIGERKVLLSRHAMELGTFPL